MEKRGEPCEKKRKSDYKILMLKGLLLSCLARVALASRDFRAVRRAIVVKKKVSFKTVSSKSTTFVLVIE